MIIRADETFMVSPNQINVFYKGELQCNVYSLNTKTGEASVYTVTNKGLTIDSTETVWFDLKDLVISIQLGI